MIVFGFRVHTQSGLSTGHTVEGPHGLQRACIYPPEPPFCTAACAWGCLGPTGLGLLMAPGIHLRLSCSRQNMRKGKVAWEFPRLPAWLPGIRACSS